MTAADYGALAAVVDEDADFYEIQGLSPDYEHAQKLRAAAAALRTLAADRESSGLVTAHEVMRLRRKVAKYIGEARQYREVQWFYERGRDESRAALRELVPVCEAIYDDEPYIIAAYITRERVAAVRAVLGKEV
jgi:hypothetical protein